MPRFASLTGLSIAALIALTACSSSGSSESADSASSESSVSTEPSAPSDSSASVSPSSSSASPSSSSAPSESSESSAPSASSAPSGSTGAAAETGSYSSADLAAMLGSVKQADGTALQIIPTAQLGESMDQARQFLDNVTVKPEECKAFTSNALETPEGAGVATGVSNANGDAVQTIVSAASSAEIANVKEDSAAAAEALKACSSISIEAQGITIQQTVAPLDATTDADDTVGTSAEQTTPDGGKQQTMTIVGTRGDLAVTAVRTAQNALPEGTQEELQNLVNATFAAAE